MELEQDIHAQFVLSYELLCLLRWLTDHNEDKLRKIVKKAINNEGLLKEIKQLDNHQPNNAEDVQHSIIDFFGMLESILLESLNEQVDKHAREQNLMPAIDQIDAAVCDDATVRFSLEKTATKIDNNPSLNAKEQLFKELLKRWKPHKKNILN